MIYTLCPKSRRLCNCRVVWVGGWTQYILWEGILLSYLLSLAGTSPDNLDHIVLVAVTGVKAVLNYNPFASGRLLTNPDNMVAFKAEGAPLTIPHGYPARLVAPDSGGASMKYLNTIRCFKKR